MTAVILKKGKEKAIQQRHHWIFSGAISHFPRNYCDGDIARIESSSGKFLGYGFFKQNQSLAGRIISFEDKDVYLSMEDNLLSALHLRKTLFGNELKTNAYRIINGEGDGFPGLVVDKYGNYLVMQIGSLGMRKLLPWIIETLKTHIPIEGIYEKSVAAALETEKIERREQVIYGSIPNLIEIREDDIRYKVDVKQGQKTGFFLDHREMRKWVKDISHGKKVLNAFCYTGGFTLAALQGGAAKVDSVDLSEKALEMCKGNVVLNGFELKNQDFFKEDVFSFLNHKALDYDIVILDPPAFAKKKEDLDSACKGYRRLFSFAFQKMPKNSFLLVSSCSYHISFEQFQKLVFQAALAAKRPVRLIGQHRLAGDHAINLYHPEGAYLKSLVLAL